METVGRPLLTLLACIGLQTTPIVRYDLESERIGRPLATGRVYYTITDLVRGPRTFRASIVRRSQYLYSAGEAEEIVPVKGAAA